MNRHIHPQTKWNECWMRHKMITGDFVFYGNTHWNDKSIQLQIHYTQFKRVREKRKKKIYYTQWYFIVFYGPKINDKPSAKWKPPCQQRAPAVFKRKRDFSFWNLFQHRNGITRVLGTNRKQCTIILDNFIVFFFCYNNNKTENKKNWKSARNFASLEEMMPLYHLLEFIWLLGICAGSDGKKEISL